MHDSDYMMRALELAQRGEGHTAPNPMVGAVIVKDGRIIGEGWHERYGDLHAERNALKHCTEDPRGSVMYVTLEPCCHHGKQPPCTDAILEAGIRRVVVGSDDPNPLVAGKGIRILREHGVEVRTHVLQAECDRLNEVFLHYMRTGRPFCAMKYAMTLDGKIACHTGASKWITGEKARSHVHMLRNRYTGIMAGIGTVLSDDPLLTCRMEGGKNPIRIIADSKLRTPLDSQIVRTAYDVPTIIATCDFNPERSKAYEAAGCRIIRTAPVNGQVDLKYLMEKLASEQIDSVLIEGGGTLHWAALSAGIVQKVHAYVSPKLFGGAAAKTPVEGTGVPDPSEAFVLKNSVIRRLGDDFLIEGEICQDRCGKEGEDACLPVS